MPTNNYIKQMPVFSTFYFLIWSSEFSGIPEMDQKPFFKWPWKRQHGMKRSSGSDHAAPCNLGHGSVLSAVTGEMSSAALFSLAHKFCRVLIQFYGAGTGLFKTLCLWSVSAAGPNTFLWTSLRRPQPNYSFKQTFNDDIVAFLQTAHAAFPTA